MQTVQQQLQERVNAALQSVLQDAQSAVAADVLQVVPCANAQFGDYQFNGALPLAKTQRTNPRALAQAITSKLDVADMSETPEIAGPGFINFRLKREFVERMTSAALADARLGVPLAEEPRTVIVDYPSPNVAKSLHIGHIRTTFIGDAIARLLRFAGHDVITDNHIGDWGTGFGKVIVGWKKYRDEANFESDPLDEMDRLYRLVDAASKADDTVLEEARAETAKLQRGDSENRAIWERLRAVSQIEFDRIYELLDIHCDETLGESFYNDKLESVVQDLIQRGIAEESQGAIAIRFEEPPQLVDKVMVIQKSDGAALYSTTDLATVQYRMERWQPDEIIYVVDVRQSLHFQELFNVVKRWGYEDVVLRHITFGTILGEDSKPIKSRSGDAIKLKDLLAEAERRALEIVREKNPDLALEQQQAIARVIGISALKYADLSPNRTSDYIFSWDKLLALQGNSAPYLLNAYVRIRAIFRRAKAENQIVDINQLTALHLEHPAEADLAKFILRFPLAIATALNDYRMNAITDYIFELAQKFHSFFEECPVLKSEEPLRSSRLALCELTARVLQQGLNLLGIETIEQM